MNGAEIFGMGGAAGYVAGQALEQAALERIYRHRSALIGAYKGAETKNRRFGGLMRPLANLALVGGVLGAAVAGAAFGNSTPKGARAPEVVAITDQDFQSGIDGSAAIEDRLASSLSSDKRLSVRLVDANKGICAQPTLQQMEQSQKYAPYSPSNLLACATQSLSNDFANAPKVRSTSLAQTKAVSGAEVIYDDGDSLGSPNIFISSYKGEGHLPIYIVNSDSSTPKGTIKSLEAIAHKTDGEYWSVTPTTETKVAEEMAHTIKPHEQLPSQNNLEEDTLIAFALALSAAEVRMFMRRSQEQAAS